MRVLLLEDDTFLSQKMATRLRRAGLSVDEVEWLDDAAVRVREHQYDCLVLDRVVPGGDSLGLVTDLRGAGNAVPVLVVSGYHVSSADRVAAFQAGADDCLNKPFTLEELTSRVHSLCRRAGQMECPLRRVGDLTVDVGRRQVVRGGRAVQLNAKELAILEMLVRRPGDVVTRRDLWEHCWGEREEPFSNTVEVHICRLRRALGEPRLIHTVRGVGYYVASPE